jgi:hypothetical protein
MPKNAICCTCRATGFGRTACSNYECQHKCCRNCLKCEISIGKGRVCPCCDKKEKQKEEARKKRQQELDNAQEELAKWVGEMQLQ